MTSFFPEAWKEMNARKYYIPKKLKFWTGVWQILHDAHNRNSRINIMKICVEGIVSDPDEKQEVLDVLTESELLQSDEDRVSMWRSGRIWGRPSPILVLWCEAHNRDPQVTLDSFMSATSDGPTLSISKYGVLETCDKTPPTPGEEVSELALRTHTACETEYNRRMEPVQTATETLPEEPDRIIHKE